MPFHNTSFHVGDYEVSATFSGAHDPVILHNVQQILLSAFVGAAKYASDDTLADTRETQYTVGGKQHHAP